jgi:hypothetical protein
MSDSSASYIPAKPVQRILATTINLAIIAGLMFFAEYIAQDSGATTPVARASVASKALFGLSAIFWLFCGQVRSSPGLALMKLRVVQEDAPRERILLVPALLRPLPFAIIAGALILPRELVPPALGAVRFLIVLVGALFLSANSTPLWSGDDRRTLIDRWLKVRVIQK